MIDPRAAEEEDGLLEHALLFRGVDQRPGVLLMHVPLGDDLADQDRVGCGLRATGEEPRAEAPAGLLVSGQHHLEGAVQHTGLTKRRAREALGVITASYEYHGGFRLRTLSA